MGAKPVYAFALAVGWMACRLAFADTGTVKHVVVPVPSKTLAVNVQGLDPKLSWTVGFVAAPDFSDAKVDALQADIQPSGPMRKVTGLNGMDPGFISSQPGTFGVSLPPSNTMSIGIFVRLPPGTEVSLNVNGKSYLAYTVTSNLLIQDGSIRHDDLQSFQQFLMAMQVPEFQPVRDLTEKQGKMFASYSAAKSHLVSFTKPEPAAAGCCGTQIRVVLDISVDRHGSVTGVKRMAGTGENVGPLESLIAAWKFEPFLWNGQAVPVEIVAPMIYIDSSVKSPLF